jgi:hypothetical protein
VNEIQKGDPIRNAEKEERIPEKKREDLREWKRPGRARLRRANERDRSAKQIELSQVADLVAAPAQDSFQREETAHWPGTGDGDPKMFERSEVPLSPCP